MTIAFQSARTAPAGATLLAVPVALGGRTIGAMADGEIAAAFLAARGFEGKVGEVLAVPSPGGGTLLAVGVGDPAHLTAEVFRKAGAAVVRAAGDAAHVATTIPDAAPAGRDREAAAGALAEGVVMAAYAFTVYKSKAKPCPVETVTLVGATGARVQAALARGARVGEAVCLARDLVNEPAGALTPKQLAAVATEVAERGGLEIVVLDEKDIKREGMGALLGVSLGSAEPPRLIQLTYVPAGGRSRATVALVGKGITFDSGGLSIKTVQGMMTMKTDMSGGAAVIAAMSALRDLDVKVRVIGIVPCTENMPGGRAVKPGDVLRAKNGKTIEVLNTDAEGRLVLADGLSLAVEREPDAIVDLATLTGAQVVALGAKIAGVMGTSQDLVDQVLAAAERAGEGAWHLPLPEEYRSHIESEIADMKNIGKAGQAGTLIAGLFLKEFVADVPWAHIDMAGPARAEADDGYLQKGGTGYGVRTMLELLTAFRKPKQ